jgi:hypothetical protein
MASGTGIRAVQGALGGESPGSKLAPVVSSAPDPRGTGYITRVDLKGVPLRTALKAFLRPLNLDYEVRDGCIFISSPERLRKETFEELETRIYELKDGGAETLPKIVVQNTGGAQGASGFGGAQGASGAGMGAAGNSGVQGLGRGSGGSGVSSGGSAQFGNISQLFSTVDDRAVGEAPSVIGLQGLRAGQAAVSGNAGAGVAAGGNRGGAAGRGSSGGNSGSAQFTNISQLFSVIDDRLVGETPAYIGR